MKPLALFDPAPVKNDYLSRYVFPAMIAYGADTGRPIAVVDNLSEIKNSTILLEAQHLSPQVILQLKVNGNDIVSFDINDGTFLCNSYYHRWEATHIDLIFKYSGIVKDIRSTELDINGCLQYTIKPSVIWCNLQADWNIYKTLMEANKFVPCAYTPWDTQCSVRKYFTPFEERRRTCLIRGGLHYLRYHLYLMLMRCGLADKNCTFNMEPYHLEAMREDLRFCSACCAAYNSSEGLTYKYYKENQHRCNQRNKAWQERFFNKNIIDTPSLHLWNNECLPSYYWLTEKFIEQYGNIDMLAVEKALNGKSSSTDGLGKRLQECMFYGDYKWQSCINFPSRHWHSAREKTITLVPRRTNDQYYFPKTVDGDHYITFSDDFSDLHKVLNITKDQYIHITENCFSQYMNWIKSDKYTLSTKMLARMFDSMEALRCIDDQFE